MEGQIEQMTYQMNLFKGLLSNMTVLASELMRNIKEMSFHFTSMIEEFSLLISESKQSQQDCESKQQIKLTVEESTNENMGMKIQVNTIELEKQPASMNCFEVSSSSIEDESNESIIDSMSAYNDSQIESREEVPEFPINLTILDNPTKFSFKPLSTVYLKNFSYENKTVELIKNIKSMVQFVSDSPIPQIGKHIIGVKILHAPQKNIYIGLIRQSRIREEYSAKICDNSIISYKIIGGKQLFVLNKNQAAHPLIESDWLFYIVDYQGETIDWYINNNFVSRTRVSLKVPNQENWHAFVTMKYQGNKVQLMQ